MTLYKLEEVMNLEDYYAYWLHRLSDAVLNKFERTLVQHDITHAQWYILVTVFQEHANTPLSVARHLEIDIGSVSRVIDRLVLKGFLVKSPSAEDRRSVVLTLSKLGVKVIGDLIPVANQQEEEWLSPLTVAERQSLAKIMRKLLIQQGLSPSGEIVGIPDKKHRGSKS